MDRPQRALSGDFRSAIGTAKAVAIRRLGQSTYLAPLSDKDRPNSATTIALEGCQGKPVTAVCQDDHLGQAPYAPWRDQFLLGCPADGTRSAAPAGERPT